MLEITDADETSFASSQGDGRGRVRDISSSRADSDVFVEEEAVGDTPQEPSPTPRSTTPRRLPRHITTTDETVTSTTADEPLIVKTAKTSEFVAGPSREHLPTVSDGH